MTFLIHIHDITTGQTRTVEKVARNKEAAIAKAERDEKLPQVYTIKAEQLQTA